MADEVNHELVSIFESNLHPLAGRLVEMLNEHFSHQTERRGCGYTQATRVMAEYINQPRDPKGFSDLSLFEHYDTRGLQYVLEHAESYGVVLESWRNLDRNKSVLSFLADESKQGSGFYQALDKETQFQRDLRNLRQNVKLEESLLLLDFIEDIILPETAQVGLSIDIKQLGEKPKVGSCPMAENFFLKIAHNNLLRKGEVNLFVHQQRVVLLEKLHMGDDHSCVNVLPVIMNGVRLPEGCLFSVAYDDEKVQKINNRHWKGVMIPLDEVEGFWFLRLTTLAVSPTNRARAFGNHFKQQIQNGLFNPGVTTIKQLRDVAMEQV